MVRTEKKDLAEINRAEIQFTNTLKKLGFSDSSNANEFDIEVHKDWQRKKFAKEFETTITLAKCKAYSKESLNRPLTFQEQKEYAECFSRYLELIEVKF